MRLVAIVFAGLASWMPAYVPGAAAQPCDGAEAAPWVTRTRHYVVSYDQLARIAVKRYGPPLSCEGKVTSEFDGEQFGVVRFRFKGGATFSMETQPPETSIASLSDSTGLSDEMALRDTLRSYTDQIGLDIDWSKPIISTEGIERTETSWDPDDGMNASARLVFRRDTLVSVRVSLAL